jgi:hypothetical protein
MRQHDHAVEPQVGRFADDAVLCAVLGGHHRLGRLLADLLQDRIVAPREQARDVRGLGVAPLAGVDHVGQLLQDGVAHRGTGLGHFR